MDWDHTLDMVSTLANWDLQLAVFDGEIDSKIAAMTAFGQTAQAFVVPSTDELEKQIWVRSTTRRMKRSTRMPFRNISSGSG
jgi:hypothetical protein